MIFIVGFAALMVGVVAGLWIKPGRQQFCPTCGTSLGCLTCKEARHATRRSERTA